MHKKRIGIMGGTFNPVHFGHMEVARLSMDAFDLDKVVFVPSGNPPHKDPKNLIDKEDRYKMVKLAIKDCKGFEASRVELDRRGFSYAVDTFNELKKEFGKTARLFYLMGVDSINEIFSWKKPLELFKLCEFIIATRPKSKIRTFKRLIKFPPIQKYINRIFIIELNVDISSTVIRNRLKDGKDVSNFVPKPVCKYIKEHDLYHVKSAKKQKNHFK